MKLMGSLNFCAPFILDFKRKVAPLIKLLSNRSDGKWREEHTSALNFIAELIWHGLKIYLVDPQKPAHLHCDADD
jgi:hypothetical protein